MDTFERPSYIDIFAGCGGISLGLHNSGWKCIFAIEKSKMAFETLKYNLIDNKNHFDWPPWLSVTEHDINEILELFRKELEGLRDHVDLITGGPPCQGFSTAGKRNLHDGRNSLMDSYIKFVEIVRPKIIFFENVLGFTFPFKNEESKVSYSNTIIRKLENLGYNVKGNVIDFSDFGVPQRRKRYILMGTLSGCPEEYFEKIACIKEDFLIDKGLKEPVTLGEAISDLEKRYGEVNSGESKSFKEGVYGRVESSYQGYMRKETYPDLPDSHRFARHRPNTIEKFKYILENCPKNRNISKKVKTKFNLKKNTIIPLDRDSPCRTLTTLPDDYIHYSEPRILTVREYARIQSFPDDYKFKNKYTTGGKFRKDEVPRYTQVGNAVPPLFAEISGLVLKEFT